MQISLALTIILATLTNAIPVPGNGPSHVTSGILLGWKGIRLTKDMESFKQSPYTSGGGELGAVLYIADSTNLAHMFATQTGYICAIHADPSAWGKIPKSWVRQAEITSGMDKVFPGSVLFASHTAAGVTSDATPWQMGIRASQIGRLGLTVLCYPASNQIVSPGQKLHYDARIEWSIHGKAERGH
ncbi:hypothetical protein DXG01_001593 [Tephrocybe rancida]|nr:hypothetical protein DXG01_001593 [Tephrocybe rancida]